MVLFNYSTRELTAKIVYYGPGLCGKTTNLQFIYEQLPEDVKGKMLSLATKTDRTLFFDFLPMDLGEIRGMKTRVQLYTVPGQVFYNETRKLVLKGADGVVFVADSQEQMMASNVESLRNLEENLKAHGMKLSEIPHVIQFNKRDLPRLASLDDLRANVNKHNAPCFEAVATTGLGVQDTLKGIARLVLVNLTRRYQPKAATATEKPQPAASAAPVHEPAPQPMAAKPATEKPSGAIPLSPLPAAAKVAATPRTAPAVPPSVLVGAATAAAAARAETPVGSFDEIEIDEMVDGLHEAAGSTDFGIDSGAWSGGASLDPAGSTSFAAAQDDGFFLGEPDPDPAPAAATAVLAAREVARLRVGETREIVVPVEIRDGSRAKQFRLALTLRLDPAD